MSHSTVPNMRVGLPVRLMSGETIGRVGAISGSNFRLEMDGGQVWLTKESIFTADIGTATLVCGRNGLSAYLVKNAR